MYTTAKHLTLCEYWFWTAAPVTFRTINKRH